MELCQWDLRLTEGTKYYKKLKYIGLHLLDANGNVSTFIPNSLPRVPQPCVPSWRA